MLAEFATWWIDRMGALAAPLLARPGADGSLLLRPIDPQGREIELLRRRRGQLQPLGRLQLDSGMASRDALIRKGSALALLCDAAPLVREIRLPLAAEAGLATLLRYEMDRMTPFRPEDVCWAWRVIRRDRREDALDLALVVLPRAAVAPMLATLAAAGLAPDHIQVRLADGTTSNLAVTGPDPDTARRSGLRWRAVLVVAASLALACVATPVLRQSLALARIADEIAAIRADVTEAQGLQRRITADAASRDALVQAGNKAASVLTALAALTDALPDDTFVTKLSMQQRRVTLEGQSAAATRLIPALSNAPHLRDPAFTAPVLRGDQGQEIFALRAELVP